ncbi:platelet glycoprotein V-like [Sitodiplosis mosellana]|uniref:platelet glycoprotein V-like n=1 Tax=Sitodiplosis mosellana TaxID=263140 RepID=UPI002444C64A|nr:platelet glycoprotein V-like [Sitodiplosis mosellana]
MHTLASLVFDATLINQILVRMLQTTNRSKHSVCEHRLRVFHVYRVCCVWKMADFGINKIARLLVIVVIFHRAAAFDVKCDQTFPSYCFIGAAIDLPANEELNIAPMDHSHMVTRFEIAPVSNLKNFPTTIFDTFPQLEAVTLNSANIRTLAPNTFEKAINLKDLHLKLNKIMKLTKSLFKNAEKLQTLDLSGNEISSIDDESFNGLPNLRTLKLNGNRLKVLKTQTFSGLEGLEYLHLYSNKLDTIEPQALNGIPKLTEVFFGNNHLRTLPADLFNNTPNLEVTEFSNNHLTHIGDAFINCHKIYSLNLENNPIADIDLVKFAKMISLSSLSLNSTGFQFPDELPTKENITTSSSAESLNLGNNNLSNANIFNHLIMFPELQRLYLYNNKFTHFNDANDIKNVLPKINTVDLIGNNFIINWLRDNYDTFRRLSINILIPRNK